MSSATSWLLKMPELSVKLLWQSKGRDGFVPILLYCSCELSSYFDRAEYPHPTISVDSCPNFLPNHASIVCFFKNYTSHVFEWIGDLKWFLKCKDKSILSSFIPCALLFDLNSIILVASVLIDSLKFHAIKEALSAVKLLYCFWKDQNQICRSCEASQTQPEAETGSAVTAASKVTKKQTAQAASEWMQQWQWDTNLALTTPSWQRLMIHWEIQKAALGTNSPDASVLQTISRKVKRCRLTGLTQ